MTKSIDVIWAGKAYHDLIEIADYIAERTPPAAAETIDKIQKKVKTLSRQPKLGRVVPELNRYGINKYREIIVSPWRIIYFIEGTDVYIVLVVDGRRNMEDVLFRRLIRPQNNDS